MLENTDGAIKNGQSRETGNIGYTRRRKTQHNHTKSAKLSQKQSENGCKLFDTEYLIDVLF